MPEGDEQAFIEAQVAAGKPVENQSKREVRTSVKQWKRAKQKKSPPPFDEINLFPAEEESEAVIQSVGEYEPNPDSELNSKPTQESDEIVDNSRRA